MALVRLTSIESSFKAELLKGQLADIGIGCVLQGNVFNHTYGPISGAEVQVLVEEEDLEKALQVLPKEEEPEEEKKEPKKRVSFKKVVAYFITLVVFYPIVYIALDYCFGEGGVKSFSEYLVSDLVFSVSMSLFYWYISKWTD